MLQIWAQKYKHKGGDVVNYQAIGSGGGIKQIEAKTVDFANSDKPLGHDEIVKNGLVQFPQVVISIRADRNLPGIKAGDLVLNGDVLSKIFLGEITKWNDPALVKLNPKDKLPATAILTVPPFRRLGHDVQLHQLSGQGQPGMAVQGGRRHRRGMARRQLAARAMPASPPACSRRRAPSAMSSMPMPNSRA